MKKMRIIYICLLGFIALQIKGQENLTLEQAISIGLENNYSIKIADVDIQIAENNDTWARAGKTPTVDLQGSFTNNLINDNNPASFLRGSFYTGSLGASANANWVIYNGGRIKINKAQLALATDQERLTKETGIHNLLRTIYQQYYEVIFQQEQLIVLEQVLALSKDRLKYEEARKEFGSSNSFNLVQFESAVMTDSNSVVGQLQSVVTAKRTIYNTLDIQGVANYNFQERLSITPEAIDEEQLKSIMSEENYTLKSLEMITALNQLNVGLAEAARKPTISLNGTIGFAENGFKFFADNPQTGEPFPFQLANRLSGNVNAVLNYNLYDGGIRKADIQNAKLEQEVNQLNILDAKAELNNQLDILIDNYKNQLALLDITDKQIQLAQRNLEITEARFKAG
jgi:outer membrane protein TolC